MSIDVDDLVLYFIGPCDYKTSVAADDCVTHRKGLQETIPFILKIRGVNVITSTLKL